MSSLFQLLPANSLLQLADSIECERLSPPFSALALRNHVPSEEREATAKDLQRLLAAGFDPTQLAMFLRLVAEERQAQRRATENLELVWTGPEVIGAGSRDTGVVVRELFSNAQHSVLVSGFIVAGGKHLFKSLADRIQEIGKLQVRIFLNISRKDGDGRADAELVHEFAAYFRRNEWPAGPVPEVYYDPRGLSMNPSRRAILHAKCIVVDDRLSFVTSANLTSAAQERNIEAGVLIDDASFARALCLQFDSLVSAGTLHKLPGP